MQSFRKNSIGMKMAAVGILILFAGAGCATNGGLSTMTDTTKGGILGGAGGAAIGGRRAVCPVNGPPAAGGGPDANGAAERQRRPPASLRFATRIEPNSGHCCSNSGVEI